MNAFRLFIQLVFAFGPFVLLAMQVRFIWLKLKGPQYERSYGLAAAAIVSVICVLVMGAGVARMILAALLLHFE